MHITSIGAMDGFSARERLQLAQQRIDVKDLPNPDAAAIRPAERIDGLVTTSATKFDLAVTADAQLRSERDKASATGAPRHVDVLAY